MQCVWLGVIADQNVSRSLLDVDTILYESPEKSINGLMLGSSMRSMVSFTIVSGKSRPFSEAVSQLAK